MDLHLYRLRPSRGLALAVKVTFTVDEKVQFTYNAYDLVTNEFVGTVDVTATVTRVWNSGRYVTLRTDRGKTFVRCVNSPSISKTD